jgi:uncharacterized protein (TIGR02453 family)
LHGRRDPFAAELATALIYRPMNSKAYFTPRLFDFLRALKANNNRVWFLAHKSAYDSDAREPMLRFIEDFAPRLRRISKHYVADPRPVGGSMFRIHRDVRFSHDKSPYKTHVAAHFTNDAGKKVRSPGFYLHLSPQDVFVGSGIWHPDPGTAAKIRAAIASSSPAWSRAISTPVFKAKCTLDGERLSRPPRGFDSDHKLIEDLKLKNFIASASFNERDACSPRFMDRFAEVCEASAPLVRFLTTAIGLSW